jgi:hypothetical protein
LTFVGVAIDEGPTPTVAAVNPALALTLKLENVSPPKSQPAADRSVTSLTLAQLIASARGGAIAQLTARRASEERRRDFLPIGNLLHPLS